VRHHKNCVRTWYGKVADGVPPPCDCGAMTDPRFYRPRCGRSPRGHPVSFRRLPEGGEVGWADLAFGTALGLLLLYLVFG